MEGSRWLSALTGTDVSLKCENLQRTGSFKIRGAYLRISNLSPEERARGVVAASAGNHAQGRRARRAAARHQGDGLHAERRTDPQGERDPGLRRRGAVRRSHDRRGLVEARELRGRDRRGPDPPVRPRRHRGRSGHLRARDHRAGRRTSRPSWCRPVAAGSSPESRRRSRRCVPDVRVVGVQAESAAAYPQSLRSRPARAARARMATMADGIAVGCPGEVPFAAIQQYVDEIRTVSEESLSTALLALMERAKVVVEPAGAAAVAALLDTPHDFDGPGRRRALRRQHRPVAADAGDPARHGGAGSLPLDPVPDPRPSGWTGRGCSRELSAAEANVLDVVHERTSETLPLDQVEVVLQLETRGQEHREWCSQAARTRLRGHRLLSVRGGFARDLAVMSRQTLAVGFASRGRRTARDPEQTRHQPVGQWRAAPYAARSAGERLGVDDLDLDRRVAVGRLERRRLAGFLPTIAEPSGDCGE